MAEGSWSDRAKGLIKRDIKGNELGVGMMAGAALSSLVFLAGMLYCSLKSQNPQGSEQTRQAFVEHIETNKGIRINLSELEVDQLTQFAKERPHEFDEWMSKFSQGMQQALGSSHGSSAAK